MKIGMRCGMGNLGSGRKGKLVERKGDGGRYLDVDVFVEFKGHFIRCFRSLLYAFNSHSRSSQLDLWILEINCVDREIDYILLFVRLAAALCPENYKPSASMHQHTKPSQESEKSKHKTKHRLASGSGQGQGRKDTFWMEDLGHFCKQLARKREILS